MQVESETKQSRANPSGKLCAFVVQTGKLLQKVAKGVSVNWGTAKASF